MIKFYFVLLATITFFLPLTCQAHSAQAKATPVVMLSIDGFRHDYIEKYQTQSLLALSKSGVRAKSLLPVYPTKTFPNHLSIVTGRYPGNHGIIHNHFYDPKLGFYKLGKVDLDKKRLKGPTIWGLVNQAGKKSHSYFWPGSDSIEQDYASQVHLAYNHNTTNKERFDTAFNWLNQHESKRPDFTTIYISSIDDSGHNFGPDSEEVAKAVSDLDSLITDFLKQIKEAEIEVDFIVVSDHGMTQVNPERNINYNTLNIDDSFITVGVSSQLLLYKTPSTSSEQFDLTIKTLQQVADGRYKLHTKESMPSHFHLTDNRATPDILLEAIPPIIFFNKPRKTMGAHGFDVKNSPDMEAIFVASGPSFKQGLVVKSFENIHIFALISHLLQLTMPTDVDAKFERLPNMLKTK